MSITVAVSDRILDRRFLRGTQRTTAVTKMISDDESTIYCCLAPRTCATYLWSTMRELLTQLQRLSARNSRVNDFWQVTR